MNNPQEIVTDAFANFAAGVLESSDPAQSVRINQIRQMLTLVVLERVLEGLDTPPNTSQLLPIIEMLEESDNVALVEAIKLIRQYVEENCEDEICD